MLPLKWWVIHGISLNVTSKCPQKKFSFRNYKFAWNPNDPCFDWSLGLVLGGENPSKIEVRTGFQVHWNFAIGKSLHAKTIPPDGAVKPLQVVLGATLDAPSVLAFFGTSAFGAGQYGFFLKNVGIPLGFFVSTFMLFWFGKMGWV